MYCALAEALSFLYMFQFNTQKDFLEIELERSRGLALQGACGGDWPTGLRGRSAAGYPARRSPGPCRLP